MSVENSPWRTYGWNRDVVPQHQVELFVGQSDAQNTFAPA